MKITITDFLLESCCDYFYLTWDICDYGYFSHTAKLGGSLSVPVSFTSPLGVNSASLYFTTDQSVTFPWVEIYIYVPCSIISLQRLETRMGDCLNRDHRNIFVIVFVSKYINIHGQYLMVGIPLESREGRQRPEQQVGDTKLLPS